MNKFILILLLLLKVSGLWANDCDSDLEHLLAHYEATTAKADMLLSSLDSSILASRVQVSERLSKLEESLQDRFLTDYEVLDRRFRKANPGQLSNAAIHLETLDEIVDFGQNLIKYVDGLEGRTYEIQNLIYKLKKLSSKSHQYNFINDLSQELLELQLLHAEHSLFKITDDWNKLLSEQELVQLRENITHLSYRLRDLRKVTEQHFTSAKEKVELLIEKVGSGDVNLILEHGQYIKDKKAIPVDVRIKAVEFEIDLALTLDRNSLSDFGHDKVTTFTAAKKSTKIPNHIQFWHYHLKRGTKDHVIIWAINKHDSKQTFYPLWVGAHGKAPYMGDKNFSNWMKGKLLFLGSDR